MRKAEGERWVGEKIGEGEVDERSEKGRRSREDVESETAGGT